MHPRVAECLDEHENTLKRDYSNIIALEQNSRTRYPNRKASMPLQSVRSGTWRICTSLWPVRAPLKLSWLAKKP